MQIIRQSLQDSEISLDIVEVIMQSWTDSTGWAHDPLHPSVRSILSFLHSLFHRGLSSSALNTARSAVSNIDINVGDQVSGPYTSGEELPCLPLP